MKIRYDEEYDVLTLRTGEAIKTSSTCELYDGFIVDFKNDDAFDPVGFELWGAAELLAPVLDKMAHRVSTKQGRDPCQDPS